MSETQQLPLSVQPVISYPREAQVGKTYLMTIDLQPSGDGEWLYEEEEYPIYCMLDTSPLFSSKPVGEPAVVLHRFGGSYGAAKFLLTAAQEEMEGEIRVTLVNGWGVPVQVLNLNDVKVRQEVDQPLRSLETLGINSSEIISEFDLRRYQEGLQERYANLNLDSLDTSVYDYREKLKVWQVFIAQNVRKCQEYLPQVYEIPKEHQKRLRESNELEVDVNPQEWERYKQVYYQQPIRSVLDIINDSQTYPYVVILGDPGSGKSTLLQYIALNWARTPLNTVIEQPIPLLIELRTYIRNRDSGECKDFLEFFHKGCGIVCRLNQHELHELLKAGKVLVMFDGLDEVFDPVKREEVITDIHRFTNDYPKARVIVTSRIIGYKPQQLRDAQFRHFMLQDLESEQIEDFLYRWHELTFTNETDKVRKRERLQKAIKTSSAIGELARNPLLLTMMAIFNRNQELPRDRPELYNQASRVLLHQWDVEQKLLENPRIDSVAIDYKDKQAMLRQVAYHMQAADKGLAGNLIRGDDLEKILTGYLKSIEVTHARTVARLLIEQLRSRNFILCFLGADSYAFVHRAFLEYFCACEFVERFGKREFEGGLTLEELKTEVFGKHWQDESWHQVLRLIISMVETKFADELINYLIEQNPESDEWGEFSEGLFFVAECFAEVRNRSKITATAVKLLNRLKRLTNDLWMCRPAVKVIATTWKDDPDTLPWVKSCIQSDDNSMLRQAAVEELAKGWKDDSDTLALLKQCAQSDDDSDVRIAALQELAKGWKNDLDTSVILKTLAQSDEGLDVRQAALRELVRGWKDDAVIELISDNQTSIESAICSDLVNKLDGKKVESHEIPDDNNEATVFSVGDPETINLKVGDAKLYGDSHFVIPFSLKVECLLTYYIFKGDYYTLDDEKAENISIDDWNDHYYEAEEYYLLEVEGLVSVNILEDEDIAIDSLTKIKVVPKS